MQRKGLEIGRSYILLAVIDGSPTVMNDLSIDNTQLWLLLEGEKLHSLPWPNTWPHYVSATYIRGQGFLTEFVD